ncbi:acyl-CoA thioesterase [Aestuariispira insulae]|uniref:Acyl-CoA thioesterase YciA n=1 Tax=Aestuariispira insulae TaxID=1461337 RepID=A0A3D9HPV7_9PROT|nr:acyl-CoA thioesterase [Aestuariispira insulae]RED50936.1 acyl-CoA thioesterase YciA [Aestuariispira insulae]
MSENEPKTPRGDLVLRDLAMPADTNPDGDIFGGWLLSQMDIAGGMAARQKAGGRVATVAIDSMVFHKPVNVGDVLCCYADLIRVGTTSMTFHIQAFVMRQGSGERELVTEGKFTFVAIGQDRRPRTISLPN